MASSPAPVISTVFLTFILGLKLYSRLFFTLSKISFGVSVLCILIYHVWVDSEDSFTGLILQIGVDVPFIVTRCQFIMLGVDSVDTFTDFRFFRFGEKSDPCILILSQIISVEVDSLQTLDSLGWERSQTLVY